MFNLIKTKKIMKINLNNLKDYKSYLGGALLALLLVTSGVTLFRAGFIAELVSSGLFLLSGIVSGLLFYYIFVDDTTY